jgi:hypothetical protein
MLGPDVDGETRPKVIEPHGDLAHTAPVEGERQVAEQRVYFGVLPD